MYVDHEDEDQCIELMGDSLQLVDICVRFRDEADVGEYSWRHFLRGGKRGKSPSLTDGFVVGAHQGSQGHHVAGAAGIVTYAPPSSPSSIYAAEPNVRVPHVDGLLRRRNAEAHGVEEQPLVGHEDEAEDDRAAAEESEHHMCSHSASCDWET